MGRRFAFQPRIVLEILPPLEADLLGLVGLGLLLYGLWLGLGGTPFFFCLFGIIMIAADDYNRRR
jgi:hypothetical protein